MNFVVLLLKDYLSPEVLQEKEHKEIVQLFHVFLIVEKVEENNQLIVDKVDINIRHYLQQEKAVFVDDQETLHMATNNLNVNGDHTFEHKLHLPNLN